MRNGRKGDLRAARAVLGPTAGAQSRRLGSPRNPLAPRFVDDHCPHLADEETEGLKVAVRDRLAGGSLPPGSALSGLQPRALNWAPWGRGSPAVASGRRSLSRLVGLSLLGAGAPPRVGQLHLVPRLWMGLATEEGHRPRPGEVGSTAARMGAPRAPSAGPRDRAGVRIQLSEPQGRAPFSPRPAGARPERRTPLADVVFRVFSRDDSQSGDRLSQHLCLARGHQAGSDHRARPNKLRSFSPLRSREHGGT